jgi:hypothetical protein
MHVVAGMLDENAALMAVDTLNMDTVASAKIPPSGQQ